MHDVLQASGQPLDATTRAFMEMRFGYDFSQVRVHANERASASARAVDALAYTVGHDVVFAEGQYSPRTADGKKLLAHELAHVVQQGSALPTGSRGITADQSAAPSSQGVVQRAEDKREAAGPTELLSALIENLERARAAASAKQNPTTDRAQIRTLTSGLEKLREVAASGDEVLKLSVLSAFTREKLEKTERQMLSQSRATTGTAARASVSISAGRPRSLAAKSLHLSNPGDAAEAEADRVAEAVVSGEPVRVRQPVSPGGVNRFVSETLIVAGETLLVADAEAAPVEAATGPPGWAVGLGIAAVAVVLIGTGIVIHEVTAEDEPEAEPAPEPRPVPAPEETETDDEPPMCSTEYPWHPECWQLPVEYLYPSAQSALGAMKSATNTKDLTLHNPSVTDSGPCVGLGTHYNVRSGGERAGSITCCPCCLDEFPPVLSNLCRIHW